MAESTVEAVAPATRGFLNELIKQWRAQDLHGSWDAKSDHDLLEPYIMTREKRLEIPLMSDPDPETLWRMELFYNAIGLTIERFTAGRLIVFNKHLRDVHRFGFDSLEKLELEGERIVADGIEWIEKYPEVAHY